MDLAWMHSGGINALSYHASPEVPRRAPLRRLGSWMAALRWPQPYKVTPWTIHAWGALQLLRVNSSDRQGTKSGRAQDYFRRGRPKGQTQQEPTRPDGRYALHQGQQSCFEWNRQENGCADSCKAKAKRMHVCEWCLAFTEPSMMHVRSPIAHRVGGRRKARARLSPTHFDRHRTRQVTPDAARQVQAGMDDVHCRAAACGRLRSGRIDDNGAEPGRAVARVTFDPGPGHGHRGPPHRATVSLRSPNALQSAVSFALEEW